MSLIEKIARSVSEAGGASDWPHALVCAQAALTAIMGEGDGVQQCDREAAADALSTVEEYDHGCDCDDCNDLRTHSLPVLAQAFARHRSTAAAAERARRDAEIVAWLRGQSDALDTSGKTGTGTLSKAVRGGGSLALHKAAGAIERGEV